LTFPDNNQPDLPFAAVGSQGFIPSPPRRRIWGYLALSADVPVPIASIRLDDSAIPEFEVSTPEGDIRLPIKLYPVFIEPTGYPIFELRGRGGEDSPVPFPDFLGPKPFRHLRDSFTHEGSIDVEREVTEISKEEVYLMVSALRTLIESDRDRILQSYIAPDDDFGRTQARELYSRMHHSKKLILKILGWDAVAPVERASDD
jgi:hypothetical protein